MVLIWVSSCPSSLGVLDPTPTAREDFAYGPDGDRFYRRSSWQAGAQTRTEHTFYVGDFEELIVDSSEVPTASIQKTRIGDSVLHVRTTYTSGPPSETYEYLHRDHLGSVEKVTDESGAELRLLAFDPFGERRKADWSRNLLTSELDSIANDAQSSTTRGFTGHEHLDRTGIVHMNGRIYDPGIGRFLSADPVVQAPRNSQSWNRYSYVMNSPLSYTDPSGHFRQPENPNDFCASSSVCMNFAGTGALAGGLGVGTVLPLVQTTLWVQTWRVASLAVNVGFGGGSAGGDLNGGGLNGGGFLTGRQTWSIWFHYFWDSWTSQRTAPIYVADTGSETDEPISSDESESEESAISPGFLGPNPVDDTTPEEYQYVLSRMDDVSFGDDAFWPDTFNCAAVFVCESRTKELVDAMTERAIDPLVPEDIDEISEGPRDFVRDAMRGVYWNLGSSVGRRSFCEAYNPCNLDSHPNHVGPVPARDTVDDFLRLLGEPK